MHLSNDDADPDDSTTGDPPTPDSDDCRVADQPICRVFGGPTSHWVQFAGPESRPANAIDPGPNVRPREESPDPDPEAEFRRAGGRAIFALLEHRLAAVERALEPVREACWRGDTPDAADLRALRTRLDDLQIAVEEHLARACPGTEPWELAGEHVPEARLAELLERDGQVHSPENERTNRDESD